MRRLTEDEFKATTVPEKERVGLDEQAPFDFWEYFDRVPPEDFGEHDFSEGRVSYAWNMCGTAYQHVLVECETPNAYLVLVLDIPGHSVAGHHLLDLNRIYGLTRAGQNSSASSRPMLLIAPRCVHPIMAARAPMASLDVGVTTAYSGPRTCSGGASSESVSSTLSS